MPADHSTQRVSVISERPVELLATGVRLRVEHLRAAYQSLGLAVDVVSAYSEDTTSTRHAVEEAKADAHRLSPSLHRSVVVCGMGGVRLLALTQALAELGHVVCVDECDSVLLRVWSPLARMRARETAWEALRILLHLRLPPSVQISYISKRDARIDSLLNRGRSVAVRPPAAAAALSALPPIGVDGEFRLVVPADFHSPHLQRGLSMLWRATADGAPIETQLFGPRRPGNTLPRGVEYAGFAPDIASVYAGDTIVFIANIGGSGVPNKLVEAASAGRPVIVHPSVRKRVDLPVVGWTYRTSAEIRVVLRSIAAGARPRPL